MSEPTPTRPAPTVGRWGHYMSTACIHALAEFDEQLSDRFHVRCRLTCKYCDAPCRCYCHGMAG